MAESEEDVHEPRVESFTVTLGTQKKIVHNLRLISGAGQGEGNAESKKSFLGGRAMRSCSWSFVVEHS